MDRNHLISNEVSVNRNQKDTVFRMLMKNRKNLLSLYNALNGTAYEDENEIEINTLENAVYMSHKNDVSFIFRFSLNLYEHQSTPNPNMPLRDLYYVADIYHRDYSGEDLYSSKMIRIKTPRFVVFYNGRDIQEEYFEYRLSDMFENNDKNPDLELIVRVYNINSGMNEKLKDACSVLKEYMIYVDKIRRYNTEETTLEEAVTRAIDECIKENVLKDFLTRNREAVMFTSLYEYDEEKHIKNEKKISYEDGVRDGFGQGIKQGIEQGIGQGKSDAIEKLAAHYISQNSELSPEEARKKAVEILGE